MEALLEYFPELVKNLLLGLRRLHSRLLPMLHTASTLQKRVVTRYPKSKQHLPISKLQRQLVKLCRALVLLKSVKARVSTMISAA